VGIGLVAGLFSALFGVGGGLIVVPLLMLVLGFSPRLAAGTSLAAIGITSLFGALTFGVLGNVEWLPAAKVGLPAMAGTLVGIQLQQRLSARRLSVVFAAFLVVIAVRLLLE